MKVIRNIERGLAGVLPFSNVSNYNLLSSVGSTRENLIERFENNGFIEYFRQHRTDIEYDKNPAFSKQYYDTNEFNLKFANTKCGLTVCHINIRRISKNKGKLIAFLSEILRDFDIILLTEIGDNAESFLTPEFLPGYIVSAIDLPKTNKYGGSAILIKEGVGTCTPRDELKFKMLCGCSNCQTENCWVELNTGTNKYLIGSIYRHCNGSILHFNEALNNLLTRLDDKIISIIGGDTNINILNQDHEATVDYTSTFFEHNFIPQILTPTRITDDTATCLDHIFVRLPRRLFDCEIISGNIIAEVTDHLPNFIYILNKNKPDIKNRPMVRIFGEKNISDFQTRLENSDWDSILQEEDIDASCSDFYQHIFTLYDASFPSVRLSIKKSKHKDWISEGLLKCIRKRDKLLKKRYQDPTETNIENFIRYRNILNSTLDTAENEYYFKKVSDKKDGIKNFWKSFGKTLNPKKAKGNSFLSKIMIDGQEIKGDENIANGMNEFFCTVGEKIYNKIPNIDGNFKNYIQNNINETFFLSAVTPADVFKQLSNLDNKKACGPDELKPKLVKTCKLQFLKPLTILFNKSIEQAKYPNDFKLSKVIALYKKESRLLPSNYRPISLLNCFNKIFEKLVYMQMIAFIDKHKILYVNQYGFRKGFSTTLAMIDVFDTLKLALDRQEYAIGIFLDLEKAFDTICHKILLSKLEHYGFRGHSNKFIKSYLSCRNQYTLINGKKSMRRENNFGVPQGSILGPLFFLLFINDISYAMKSCKGKLFADDTCLLLHHKHIQTLIRNAQKSLADISAWFKLNKLSLSLGKSNFILFHNPKQDPCNWLQTLKAGEDDFPRAQVVKYIGLHVDEKLTWKDHINEVYKSLTKYFSIFYNIRGFIDKRLTRTVYHTCIHSKIKYGIEVYGTANETYMNKLQVLQNKLMKVLTKKERKYSTNLLHKDLNILKVHDIHRLSVLNFVYRSKSNKIISNFKNYFPTRGEQHTLNLRNNDDLDQTFFTREHGRKTVQRIGAVYWNELPDNLKDTNVSQEVFKSTVFKHFSSQYNE